MEVTMPQSTTNDYVKIPKREYDLLKEIYRTVKRQALLVRLDEAEKSLAVGKTRSISIDDFIGSV